MKPCRIQAISLILAGRLLFYMRPTTACRKRSPSAVATAVGGLAGVFLLIEIPACVDGFPSPSRLWENCRIKSLTMGREIGAQNPKSRERPSLHFWLNQHT